MNKKEFNYHYNRKDGSYIIPGYLNCDCQSNMETNQECKHEPVSTTSEYCKKCNKSLYDAQKGEEWEKEIRKQLEIIFYYKKKAEMFKSIDTETKPAIGKLIEIISNLLSTEREKARKEGEENKMKDMENFGTNKTIQEYINFRMAIDQQENNLKNNPWA